MYHIPWTFSNIYSPQSTKVNLNQSQLSSVNLHGHYSGWQFLFVQNNVMYNFFNNAQNLSIMYKIWMCIYCDFRDKSAYMLGFLQQKSTYISRFTYNIYIPLISHTWAMKVFGWAVILSWLCCKGSSKLF